MVDALREAWRVLSLEGVLVDLRPRPALRCPIELVSGRRAIEVGEVDASGTAADDAAADRAIGRLAEEGRFRSRRQERFDVELYWDSVGEMAAFMEGSRRVVRVRPSWADLERLLRTWAAGGVRLRILRPMGLGVYGKVGAGRGSSTVRRQQETLSDHGNMTPVG